MILIEISCDFFHNRKNLRYYKCIILLLSVISIIFSEPILKPNPFFSISTKGFITGKVNNLDIIGRSGGLNNHATFYGEVFPHLYYNKSNFLSLGFNIYNSEFSIIDRFSFRPLILANIGNSCTESLFKWRIRAGIIPFTTIGNGLTIKDFRQIGAEAGLSIGGFNSLITVWAQGYTQAEDIYRLKVFYENFPLKLNLIFWNIQGYEYLTNSFDSEQYYYSAYFLPYFSHKWRQFDFYGEYGFKYKKDVRVSEYYDYIPDKANGLLFGIAYTDTIFNFKIALNPEFRYYGKGFIPNTGVSSKFLGPLETWYHSTNNWIDFFNSRKKSLIFYTRFYVETPSIKGFSIYFQDELLYFNSTQKALLMTDDLDQYFLAFNPSTNFYKAGIKYSFGNVLNISINMSNQLINIDPFLNNNIHYSQYMTRFYPTEKPFAELLLQWNIKDVKRNKDVKEK